MYVIYLINEETKHNFGCLQWQTLPLLPEVLLVL